MNPEQKKLFAQLTHLQQRFVTNLLSGMLQHEAYSEASGRTNYDSAKTNASRMAELPNVKAFLMSIKEEAVSEAVMTRQEALERLTMTVRSGIHEIAEIEECEIGTDKYGNPVLHNVWRIRPEFLDDPAKLAMIQELMSSSETAKVRLQAIQQLAKMQGWDSAQKVDLSNSDGTLKPQVIDASKLSTETLEELLAAKTEE